MGKKVLNKNIAVKQVIGKLVSFPPEKTSPQPAAIPVSQSRIIISIGGRRFAVDITTTATPLRSEPAEIMSLDRPRGGSQPRKSAHGAKIARTASSDGILRGK